MAENGHASIGRQSQPAMALIIGSLPSVHVLGWRGAISLVQCALYVRSEAPPHDDQTVQLGLVACGRDMRRHSPYVRQAVFAVLQEGMERGWSTRPWRFGTRSTVSHQCFGF